jgi:hypothetical protein
MKNLLYLLVVITIIIALPGCYTADEYFFEARPDSTGIERDIALINDNFVITSKVFYRNFQEELGISKDDILKYEQVKVKGDGSILIIGSKQTENGIGSGKFQFKTDENFSNLTTIATLNSFPENLTENYVTGPSDDYFFQSQYNQNGNSYYDIFKNGDSIGTVRNYSSKYQPAWQLDANNNIYNFVAIDGSTGSGINGVDLIRSTPPIYSWLMPVTTIRSTGFMIGIIPYFLGVKGSKSLDVYRGDYVELSRNAQQVRYRTSLFLTTTNVNAFGHVYHNLVDGMNAYILALEYNKFRLVKFNAQTNIISQEADFTADYTYQNAQTIVKMQKSGASFILVIDGYGVSEDGSHKYELFKVSAEESKSYGIIDTKDFDSQIPLYFEDFYIINNKPVLWFSSRKGYTYSDHLLVISPK